MKKKDLTLLVRLTSGLHDNDDDDGIVVHIYTWKGFYSEERKREREKKKTDDDDKEKKSLFELIEFHGSILERKKNRYTMCLSMFGTIK